MSFDKTTFYSLTNIYNSLPKTAVAAATTWTLCRSVSRLGLDAKTVAIFTVAASVISEGSKPFINEFIGLLTDSPKSNWISHLGLTYVATKLLKLDLPLYQQFGKAYAVATGTLAAIQFGFAKLAVMNRPPRDQL